MSSDGFGILLPDGTFIPDITLDGLGHLTLPGQVIIAGLDIFTANVYGTDGISTSAELTIDCGNFQIEVGDDYSFGEETEKGAFAEQSVKGTSLLPSLRFDPTRRGKAGKR